MNKATQWSAMALLLAASQADAATYHFYGRLSAPFGSHPAGAPFTGTLSYTFPQADQSEGNPRGDYRALRFMLRIGEDRFNDIGSGMISVYDDSWYPADSFYFGVPGVGTLGGLQLYSVSITLSRDGGGIWEGTDLPGSLTLGDFQHESRFIQLWERPRSETGAPPGYEEQVARGTIIALCDAEQLGNDVFPFGDFEPFDAEGAEFVRAPATACVLTPVPQSRSLAAPPKSTR